jgi:hypothetical protein
VAIAGGQAVARDHRIESVSPRFGKQSPRQPYRAEHARGERLAGSARNACLRKAVVEARVVRDEHGVVEQPRQIARDARERRRAGDHRIGDAGQRDDRRRNRHAGIDECVPLGNTDAVALEIHAHRRRSR